MAKFFRLNHYKVTFFSARTCPVHIFPLPSPSCKTCALPLDFALEHVYMKPEVNSDRFEMSNRFEKSFRLQQTLLFKLALVRTSHLFEPFFIPRGYSLTSSTKNPSVIRTFSYSNFRLFEPISEPP